MSSRASRLMETTIQGDLVAGRHVSRAIQRMPRNDRECHRSKARLLKTLLCLLPICTPPSPVLAIHSLEPESPGISGIRQLIYNRRPIKSFPGEFYETDADRVSVAGAPCRPAVLWTAQGNHRERA